MVRRTRERLLTVVALLGVVLLSAEALAREPKRAVESTRVYLRKRLVEIESMPACTPLQIAKSDAKSSKLTHAQGRWDAVWLRGKAYEEAGPAATFGDCLKDVAEYQGRYTERQVEALETGRLTLGMPAEFAMMLLGPPATVNGKPLEATSSPLLRSAALEWFPWLALLQVDAAGRIERIQLAGADRTALFVEGEAKTLSVTSRRRGVVMVSRRDPAYAEFSRAMTAYDADDHTGAFSALLKLAEGGHAPSQYAVGDMLYRGDGVTRDLDRAGRWISLAASSFQPGALYHVGLLQLRGEGVPQDPVAAYASMRLAAQLGNLDAPKIVARLEQELDDTELAAAKEMVAAKGLSDPVLIHRVEPQYPEAARSKRLSGHVALQAVIGPDGLVSDIELLQARPLHWGWQMLAEAAIKAVSLWRYEPARRTDTGEALAVYFTVFVDFEAR